MDVIEDRPAVELELESRPEALTLVRGTVGALGDVLALDAELLDDLKTAISEACNNVVLHAYDGLAGPLGVRLYLHSDTIEVTVSDEGSGIVVTTPTDDVVEGVGLPVIRALTQHADFTVRPGGGTQVTMVFSGYRDGQRLFQPPTNSAPLDRWAQKLSGEAVVSLSPLSLLGSVLGRLARALAARARFSLDRFSDVYLVTDAIAAHAATAAKTQRVAFSISTDTRRMDLMIGPFRAGASAELRRGKPVHDARSALAMLSDQLEIVTDGDAEMVRVVLLDRRPSAAA